MAPASQHGFSPKTISFLPLLLLLLQPLPASSLLAAADSSASPGTSNVAQEQSDKTSTATAAASENRFSICKLTGHFRFHMLGIMIECPEVDPHPPIAQIQVVTAPIFPVPAGHLVGFSDVHSPPVSPMSVDVAFSLKPEDSGDDESDAAGAKEGAARSGEL